MPGAPSQLPGTVPGLPCNSPRANRRLARQDARHRAGRAKHFAWHFLPCPKKVAKQDASRKGQDLCHPRQAFPPIGSCHIPEYLPGCLATCVLPPVAKLSWVHLGQPWHRRRLPIFPAPAVCLPLNPLDVPFLGMTMCVVPTTTSTNMMITARPSGRHA